MSLEFQFWMGCPLEEMSWTTFSLAYRRIVFKLEKFHVKNFARSGSMHFRQFPANLVQVTEKPHHTPIHQPNGGKYFAKKNNKNKNAFQSKDHLPLADRKSNT